MKQLCINDNKLNTNNTSNMGNTSNTSADTDKKRTWFWYQSTNELEFDLECNVYSDSKKDLEPKAKKRV